MRKGKLNFVVGEEVGIISTILANKYRPELLCKVNQNVERITVGSRQIEYIYLPCAAALDYESTIVLLDNSDDNRLAIEFSTCMNVQPLDYNMISPLRFANLLDSGESCLCQVSGYSTSLLGLLNLKLPPRYFGDVYFGINPEHEQMIDRVKELVFTNGVTKLVVNHADSIDPDVRSITEYMKLTQKVMDFIGFLEDNFELPVVAVRTGDNIDDVCFVEGI